MAMSRSLGDSVLTTRLPMRSTPLVMSSRPATMRSAVLLPQPDGPTRTRNSPSVISRSRSFTAWNPFSYFLLIFSRMTSAMVSSRLVAGADSALDRAGGQPADDVALQELEQRHRRDRRQDRAGAVDSEVVVALAGD